MSGMDILTADPLFLTRLGHVVAIAALGAVVVVCLHRAFDQINQRTPEQQQLDELYVRWRVFLLTLRIAAYQAKTEQDRT